MESLSSHIESAKIANSKFPDSQFQFRPPALLANSKFPDSQFQFRPPALLANSKFPDSKFQSRPPALLANCRYLCKFPNSKFQSRPKKAPKAKRFRIPRVRRLKLQFPPCNHAQPGGGGTRRSGGPRCRPRPIFAGPARAGAAVRRGRLRVTAAR